MFHVVFSVASRFLFLGNMLHSLARGILALRSLGSISSHLVPTLSPPPPILLLDAARPFVELPQETISPYPSVAVEHIARRTPVFSSSIPSYQSSLISVTPTPLPNFLPLFITLAIISGFVIIILPGIVYLFSSVDEQPERHMPWSQHVYAQFVASQNGLRHQLELSRGREQKLHAELRTAEQENESMKELIPTLKESDDKRRAWEIIAANARACRAEAETTVTKLRADLTAALDRVRDVREQLDRQTLLLSGKDHTVQSITEESQVARVKLKNAENTIERLNIKLQCARDLRHRQMQKMLGEQARVRDRHESEMRRVTQEAQDAREQLEKLRLSSDVNGAFTDWSDSMLLEMSMALQSPPNTLTRESTSLFPLPPPPPTKADGKLRRGRRTSHYRGSSPPRNRIPKLDYGLPEDFVPSFGRLAPTLEFNDFGCIIPLDCPTSTPVASRKRPLKNGLPGSGASPAALAVQSYIQVRDLSPSVGKGLLPSPDIFA